MSAVIERQAVRDIAAGLGAEQARWLVDYYYAIQDYRIQASGQTRAVEQGADEASFEIGKWLASETTTLETTIRKALDNWSDQSVPGVWAKSITGIGPVISAGLLAHIDIRKCPTTGHIWSFAGLNPDQKWIGKNEAQSMIAGYPKGMSMDEMLLDAAREANRKPESLRRLMKSNTRKGLASALAKRPFNVKLKVLSWKIGDSFVKQSGRESDVYGHVYRERKAQEVSRNEAGMFADQAKEALETRNIRDRNLKACYETGRLPDGRIDLRARRYAVKLFLAHYHHVAYEDHFGTPPPKPYILDQPGHTHFFAPPNWPMA